MYCVLYLHNVQCTVLSYQIVIHNQPTESWREHENKYWEMDDQSSNIKIAKCISDENPSIAVYLIWFGCHQTRNQLAGRFIFVLQQTSSQQKTQRSFSPAPVVTTFSKHKLVMKVKLPSGCQNFTCNEAQSEMSLFGNFAKLFLASYKLMYRIQSAGGPC